jgi:hypothetical protein
VAAVLLQSKGRSASVAHEEAPAVGSVANRLQRSISNQIEEDAVNGLLNDLLSPMVEERHRTGTANAVAAAAAEVAAAATKPAGGSPVVARRPTARSAATGASQLSSQTI